MMSIAELQAHHRSWAAYTLACAAELRASTLRAQLTPFGTAESRAAEVARYEARIDERVAEHEHHVRMALEYQKIQDSAGIAREAAEAGESRRADAPAPSIPSLSGAGAAALRDCDDCRSVAPCDAHGPPRRARIDAEAAQ